MPLLANAGTHFALLSPLSFGLLRLAAATGTERKSAFPSDLESSLSNSFYWARTLYKSFCLRLQILLRARKTDFPR